MSLESWVPLSRVEQQSYRSTVGYLILKFERACPWLDTRGQGSVGISALERLVGIISKCLGFLSVTDRKVEIQQGCLTGVLGMGD